MTIIVRPTWQQTRDAIHAAIVSASGLATDHVIWSWQNVDAPDTPYIELALTPSMQIGQDWIDETYDVTRPAGKEIELAVRGTREVKLAVTIFSLKAVDTGNIEAVAVAQTIQGKLLLPSVRNQMAAVGVTPFDPSHIVNVPAIIKAGFRGRAVLDVRCYMPAIVVADYIGWIQFVQGTLGINGVTRSYSIDMEDGSMQTGSDMDTTHQIMAEIGYAGTDLDVVYVDAYDVLQHFDPTADDATWQAGRIVGLLAGNWAAGSARATVWTEGARLSFAGIGERWAGRTQLLLCRIFFSVVFHISYFKFFIPIKFV